MRIGSLFSGIGGLELGLEWAGVGETVWQVEQDEYCRRVLEKHWPNATRYDDVRAVGVRNLESVDVICGGFPCQDISYAGKGAGLAGERSGLWFEFARIVREMGPEYVVVENVPALLDSGLGDVLGTLADVGYDAEWSCVSACSVGAPHTRDRVFILAHAHPRERSASRQNGDKARPAGLSFCGGLAARKLSAWFAVEPDMARMVHGLPEVVDRAAPLGNAVVPQVAEVVGRRLLEIDAERRGVAA